MGDPGYQMVAQVSLPLCPGSSPVHCNELVVFSCLCVTCNILLLVPSMHANSSDLTGSTGAQAYPFVVRKVLRDSSSGGARMLLRDMLFDASGSVKPARMSAVLNAALGYVAEQTDGFVDFDAVPADGAPLQVCVYQTLSRSLASGLQCQFED